MRPDGRQPHELRPVKIEPGFLRYALGSVLIEMGETKVVCTVSLEDGVPQFLRNTGRGWLTAEYGMLPGCSQQRIQREASRGRVGGRTHEIQRLIGRSLRAVTDLALLGERTLWVDCDVIQADGGTRTAAITGAYVALAHACLKLQREGMLLANPLRDSVAAVSVGIVQGTPLLDLCYAEDSAAEVDMNVVMTGSGKFVEIQGTAETNPFGREDLERLTDLAALGIRQLTAIQADTVARLS
ncbi:MAG: ribonuclease PH [Candidatus Binatia bacterium]|nr:MAG: ribonuclease PH [Candidatus Binatia bacterium]